MREELHRLVQDLHTDQTLVGWSEWEIERVDGGRNGMVFRVSTDDESLTAELGADVLAVKFTAPGPRQRARREHIALDHLHTRGSELAPRPLLLDEALSVVVTEWIPGVVLESGDRSDEQWLALIDHYFAIQMFTEPGYLPEAVLDMRTAADGVKLLEAGLHYLPETDASALAAKLGSTDFPDWDRVQPSLCRVDPTPNNFIDAGGPLRSVDWENAGLGDPAFEIACLLEHPEYLSVPSERKRWVAETYAERLPQPQTALRIAVYRELMQMWWMIRLARVMYELPRGLDPRLADNSDLVERSRTLYGRYRAIAFP